MVNAIPEWNLPLNFAYHLLKPRVGADPETGDFQLSKYHLKDLIYLTEREGDRLCLPLNPPFLKLTGWII